MNLMILLRSRRHLFSVAGSLKGLNVIEQNFVSQCRQMSAWVRDFINIDLIKYHSSFTYLITFFQNRKAWFEV